MFSCKDIWKEISLPVESGFFLSACLLPQPVRPWGHVVVSSGQQTNSLPCAEQSIQKSRRQLEVLGLRVKHAKKVKASLKSLSKKH